MRNGLVPVGILVTILYCVLPKTGSPQQPVALDPSPLERPSAMTVIKTRDPIALYGSLAKLVTEGGFTIMSQDSRSGTVIGTKNDETSVENYDKVVVWLERDFQQPSEFVNVYFAYGRFEKVFGRSEPARIKITAQDEQHRVGQLKQALLLLGH
jgi:hypothetical protein